MCVCAYLCVIVYVFRCGSLWSGAWHRQFVVWCLAQAVTSVVRMDVLGAHSECIGPKENLNFSM